jgi:hypothetical protein
MHSASYLKVDMQKKYCQRVSVPPLEKYCWGITAEKLCTVEKLLVSKTNVGVGELCKKLLSCDVEERLLRNSVH